MAKRPTAIKTALTKTQIIASLSESTGLDKKQVGSVLTELEGLVERHVRKHPAQSVSLYSRRGIGDS